MQALDRGEQSRQTAERRARLAARELRDVRIQLLRQQRDEKPKHGSPDFARDIAMQKIANRVEGARLASEELRA